MLDYNVVVKINDKELVRYIVENPDNMNIITKMNLVRNYKYYKEHYESDVVVYKVEEVCGTIKETEIYRDEYYRPIDLNKIDDSELTTAQLMYKYAGKLD